MPGMDTEARRALGALALLKAEGGSRPGTLRYSYLLKKSTLRASVSASQAKFLLDRRLPLLALVL